MTPAFDFQLSRRCGDFPLGGVVIRYFFSLEVSVSSSFLQSGQLCLWSGGRETVLPSEGWGGALSKLWSGLYPQAAFGVWQIPVLCFGESVLFSADWLTKPLVLPFCLPGCYLGCGTAILFGVLLHGQLIFLLVLWQPVEFVEWFPYGLTLFFSYLSDFFFSNFLKSMYYLKSIPRICIDDPPLSFQPLEGSQESIKLASLCRPACFQGAWFHNASWYAIHYSISWLSFSLNNFWGSIYKLLFSSF